MTTTKSLRSIITLSLALATLLGYSFISAWTAPPSGTVPPANNVLPPLNSGSTAQDKAGTLTAEKLGVIANSPILELIDATTNEKDWRLGIESGGTKFVMRADRNMDGIWDSNDGNHQMLIANGTSTEDDYVQFSNNVRATEYCNRAGTECADITDLINLLPVSCSVKFSYSYDSSTVSTQTKTITADADSEEKFAVGILTNRTNGGFGDDPVSPLSTELRRYGGFDCGYYDWNNSCHFAVIGYISSAKYDVSPASYNTSAASNQGHGSSGYIYRPVSLLAGTKVSIDNIGHDGFGADRVHLDVEVLSCK